ncbi:MAG: PAS domain-containing protein [Candidatus Latescibacteria bacterium]|nr:PAS domain-containing protein [bacterium]MBD3422939.1 PAS domain-containing protein [Candidatus Latescibacterota bacterium]
MEMNRFIILSTCFFLFILTAAIFLPVEGALFAYPLVIIAAVIMIRRNRVEYERKVEKVRRNLRNLRSEGLYIEERVHEKGDIFYNTLLAILKDMERTMFKLVEKNIQLLSLKEIGRNIISSLDEKKLVESMFDYLMQGVGYKEVALLMLRRSRNMIQAIVNIEKGNKVVRRVINFDLSDLEGAVMESLKAGKPFMIKDASMHPLPVIDGKELFPGSTMSSFICVPLLKNSQEMLCGNDQYCILANEEESDEYYLTDNRCLSCPEIPMLGALIVTDGYRATPLTKIDQVTIETVSSLVSANIENWGLYQNLKQEEKFRDKILEGMIHGLIVTDLDGIITFVNRSTEILSQKSAEELEGTNLFELIEDIDGEVDEKEYFDTLYLDGSISFREAVLRGGEDHQIPIRMNVSRFLGENDELQGAIVLFVDLSDIKEMEKEIRQLDRLAALGRFTSAIAHEIRNPLTGIGAGIQYLKRSSEFNEEQEASIESILSEVSRLDRIISDLFKVAKPRDILYQKTDVSKLIERSYNSVKEILINHSVDFELQVQEDIPEVEIDPDQISQVLINLFKNSAESIEGTEGRVLVTATHNRRANDSGRAVPGKLKIRVEDNGCGIDPEHIDRVFEPFFSRKNRGTGLGLYICHSIIKHHHGRMEVESEKGRGTTFTVVLPTERYGGR